MPDSTPSERYLFPVLVSGPGNMYVGFREAAILARRLGRTLVLPHFVVHNTVRADSARNTIPFADTFDVDALRPLLPVVRYEALGPRPTRLFHIRKRDSPGQRMVDRYLAHVDPAYDVALAALPHHWLERRYIQSPADLDELRALDDEVLCVAGIFNTVKLSACLINHCVRCPPHPAFAADYDDVCRHTRRAAHIRDRAAAFIADRFGDRPFVAFHLRTFDRVERGDLFATAYPLGVSEAAVHDALLRWADACRINPQDLFVAMPPAARRIADLDRFARATVFDDADLEPYFASLVEQEVCARAAVFVRSVTNKARPVEHDRSSWGACVDEDRRFRTDTGRDRSIDELLRTHAQDVTGG